MVSRLRTTAATPRAAASPAGNNQRVNITGAVDRGDGAPVLAALSGESIELWFAPTAPRKSIH